MKKKLLYGISLILLVFLIYVIIDNNRVYVNEVTISHNQLPDQFNHFKILQITDLHGKTFGTNQDRLINKINELEFDVIFLTGDYLDDFGDENYKPLEDLLEGLPKEKPIYYVLGNQEVVGNYEFIPHTRIEIMDLLEDYGATHIYPIQKIEKDDASIFLTGISYKEEEFKKLNFIPERDFNIAVIHRPIDYDVDERFKVIGKLHETDYNISIAGHTHGGQIRLPFIGAIIGPNNEGLFPPESEIYGLHADNNNRKNFISSGLGNTGPWFLQFRLFNPPEIALITLEKEE
jgi:uncharacterized protein